MYFNRIGADIKLPGDFLIACPCGYQAKDFLLSLAEVLVGF
jgi:hypothetical protein